MNEQTLYKLKYSTRIVFTIGLLVWVFHIVDIQKSAQMTKTARWEYIGILFLMVNLLFLLQGLKGRYIFAKQGCDVSVGRLYCLSALVSLYGLILPGILSTGIKWYILKKDTGKGGNVLSAMAYNQLSIMVVMVAFGCAAFIADNPVTRLTEDAKVVWICSAAAGLILAVLLGLFLLLVNRSMGQKAVGAVMRTIKFLPENVVRKIDKVLHQIAQFQTAGYRFHFTVLVLTIIINLGGAVAIYFISAKASNIVVPLGTLIWISGVLYILGRLPISIGNLGVREVALVGLLPLYGVDKSSALLMSITVFCGLLFRALIGAICQLVLTFRTRRVK